MFQSLHHDGPGTAALLFTGGAPQGPEELGGLAAVGTRVEVEPGLATDADGRRVLWRAKLEHDSWGTAQVTCFDEGRPAIIGEVGSDRRLGRVHREALQHCDADLQVTVGARSGQVLRDRKDLLRCCTQLWAEGTLLAVDLDSRRPWTRDALDDELAHDADLDVESIFHLHAVVPDQPDQPDQPDEGAADAGTEGPAVSWLHSHGLGELGAHDFDILAPSRSFLDSCGSVTRALAFASLEGWLQPFEPVEMVARVEPFVGVPVRRFEQTASAALRSLRDDPHGEHVDGRLVLGAPSSRGWSGPLRRGSFRTHPLFADVMPDGLMTASSKGSTELVAERARRTLGVLAEIRAELAEFDFSTLVKIGFAVDGGSDGEREHLWFSVHELHGEAVDATLVNAPFHVAALHEGQRGEFALEGLSDWVMFTPLGEISPRNFEPRRRVRAKREELRRWLRKQG